jgi:hypothetical protein
MNGIPMSLRMLGWRWIMAAGTVISISTQIPEVRRPRIHAPLPVVERTKPGGRANLFDRPSIVLIARIVERREVEARTFEGQSLDPPRWWGAVQARPVLIARVNERRTGDPDLGRGEFLIEQEDRGEKPLRFEFGREYVLLLNPSPLLRGRPASTQQIDVYRLALPEGGFEIIDDRLLPLVSGGELDSYKGRAVNDVLAEIYQPLK